ncbi:MAG: PD40 domain-containing protein [Anaerolineae bacterium]|nr:PD40 domain-containing protein [Anaerolineae bacterium]
MLLRLTVWGGLIAGLAGALLMGMAVSAGALMPRTELVYVSYHDTQSDLIAYDAARSLGHNLTRSRAYELSPVWSPDGSQIAFVSDRAAGLHIYVMDAGGRNIRRLTPPGRAFEAPRWSADGARLAFVARGSAGVDIFTVNADGSGFEQVSGQTTDPGSIMLELGLDTPAASGPQSPSGEGLLSVDFVEHIGWALVLSEANGEPGVLLASLGRNFGETAALSWSPDGQRIAYLSSTDGQVDLYIIAPVPGSHPQRVTHNRAYESSPVWRPLNTP